VFAPSRRHQLAAFEVIVSATEVPHIKVMSGAKPKHAKIGRRPAKIRPTYRGVRLQAIGGRSRFTLDQIKQAVEAAVVKNADALARKT